MQRVHAVLNRCRLSYVLYAKQIARPTNSLCLHTPQRASVPSERIRTSDDILVAGTSSFTVRLQLSTVHPEAIVYLHNLFYAVSLRDPSARTRRQAFAISINDRFAFDMLHISSDNGVD
jgi:hypothetical protein